MTGQIIELPWRETRMGGITDHVVVCPTCRAVTQPYSGTSSRGETHGTVFYSHEHPVAVLTLIQSNKSLNRHHELTLPPEAGNEVKEVLEKAGRLWDVRKLSSRQDVEDFLQAEGWKMQTNPQIELYWRAGPMLGVTEHIVVCPTCGTIVHPEITSVGEEGWHGTHTYSHEHPLAILGLLQSGFGTNRRHILTLPGDLTNHKVADLLTEAGHLWDARKLVSKTDVEEFILNKLADTTPPRKRTQETDTLEKLLLGRNPSKHLQDCLEKRRAFLNLVEKLGYRQLTEDEEVFLTSCPDVREYGYFIWDEESDNYLFDAYVEVHVRDGDGEVLAITLTLTTRKLTPEAKEWLEVKQYVLYEHENFRELVRKFLEQVEKKAGKPKPDQ